MGGNLCRGVVAAAVLGIVAVAPAAAAPRSSALWTSTATPKAKARAVRPAHSRSFTLDRSGMRRALASAPKTLSLPAPDGRFQRFTLRPSSVLGPELAREHPDIRTFSGRGIDDKTATLAIDIGPLGFHASVRSVHGSWYVDPALRGDDRHYATYFGRDLTGAGSFLERELPHERATPRLAAALPPEVTLRTYRLALVSDPSYADYFADGETDQTAIDDKVFAAKTALVNRVDQIYDDELAIHLTLTKSVDLNTAADMTGPNGPCGGAPCYTADNPETPDDPADGSAAFCDVPTLRDTETTLGQTVGASNYDIGHVVLGNEGGGIAALGVVGGHLKGWGCTGVPTPQGDYFAVDYVAHEMGHEFGANHPFNGKLHNCGPGNREPTASVEPGSGSSIMGYAGICRQDNLQPHSDPYFSQRSFDEITGYTSTPTGPIDEIQNVGLVDYTTETLQVSYPGHGSATIAPSGYNRAGIKAAIETLLPGASVTIDKFGHSPELDGAPPSEPDHTGFEVTFGGTLAGTDVADKLSVTGVTSIVGETEEGGATENLGFTHPVTTNHRPVVTAPPSRFIPTRTPFSLTGSAADQDGDTVTYMWEQNDRGGVNGTALADNHKVDGPLFRQFGTAASVSTADSLHFNSPGENAVTTDPTRVFPDLAQILAGSTDAATGRCPAAPADPLAPLPSVTLDCFSEFLPTADWLGVDGTRTLHFRLTARDGHPGAGGVGRAETTVQVVPTAGPFRITAPAGGTALGRGEPETVRWDVAGTNAPPISVGQVAIGISIDGGATFSTLVASTPNDGSEQVAMPDVASPHLRVRVAAVGSPFFDISHGDASLEYAPAVNSDAPSGGLHVQYSDPVAPVTITASDRDADGSGLTATATGLPAGFGLTTGPASGASRNFTVAGTTTAAPGTYPVSVTVRDAPGAARTVSFPVVVAPESASVTYTGDRAAEGSTGTATLAVRVAEASDGSPGDLRTANVTFLEAGRTVCGPLPVSAAGTASCAARLGDSAHRVDIAVDGAYTGSGSGELAPPMPPLCSGLVVLTDVSKHGSRVRLAGLAQRRLAAQRVTLTANGRTIGHAKVAKGGAFSTRVKAPRGRRASRTAYRAKVAGGRSPVLRLGRPLTVSVSGTRIRGRLTGRGHSGRPLGVVRSTSCTGKATRVKRIRTDRAGRFSVRLARPKTGASVVYTVRTASGKPSARSLPVVMLR